MLSSNARQVPVERHALYDAARECINSMHSLPLSASFFSKNSILSDLVKDLLLSIKLCIKSIRIKKK